MTFIDVGINRRKSSAGIFYDLIVGALLAAARILFQKGGLWFHLHRAFMIIGVLLNIAGFTGIFIEKGGFVEPSYTLGKIIQQIKI